MTLLCRFAVYQFQFNVQDYIKDAGGADIRCFVAKDKVVAAKRRQSAGGEFRCNLHCSGSAILAKSAARECVTAVNRAKLNKTWGKD